MIAGSHVANIMHQYNSFYIILHYSSIFGYLISSVLLPVYSLAVGLVAECFIYIMYCQLAFLM